MGWNDEILLQQYGPRLRQMRKFVNDAVSLNQTSIQERETVNYLKRVLESPDRHVEHARQCVQPVPSNWYSSLNPEYEQP